MQGSDPRQPVGQLSPDGMWRWDGSRWQAEPSVMSPLAAPRVSTRSWLATGGGIVALIAIPFIVAACIFPFVYYSGNSNGGSTSSSIFNLGYPGGVFFALEPVAVTVCTVLTAILLIAWQHQTVRAVGAGVLVAFGIQTIALFIGYIGGEAPYGRLGPGGAVGTLGGLVILVGGGLAAASVFVRQASRSEQAPS